MAEKGKGMVEAYGKVYDGIGSGNDQFALYFI